MADSLLAALEELNEQELRASEYASDAVLVIDNDLRTIAVPSNFIFGVYNDKNVLSVNFEMPRTYDDVDLSGFTIQINYLAPNKVGNVYEVTDPVVGEDKITFEWLLDRGVFLSSGTVEFTVCLREIGQEGAIIREFNTTIAKGTVLAGLEIEDPEDPEAYSLLAHIKQMDERVTSQAATVASDYAKTARIADDVEAIAEELADDVAEVKEKYGTPLVAPTAAGMIDHAKIYVYTGNETGYTFGNWYYYDGAAWTSGGVYNSAGINTDATLSVSGMPADAKKTGDEISGLKEDLDAKGLSDSAKVALLACFAKVAWTDEHGQDYYDALETALYPNEYPKITAVYDSSHTAYDTDILDSLKPYITLTYYENEQSASVVVSSNDYTLLGDLNAGVSIITVKYGAITTNINVNVATHYIYRLPQATTFNGIDEGIVLDDLGLFDLDRDYSIVLDADENTFDFTQGRYAIYRMRNSAQSTNVMILQAWASTADAVTYQVQNFNSGSTNIVEFNSVPTASSRHIRACVSHAAGSSTVKMMLKVDSSSNTKESPYVFAESNYAMTLGCGHLGTDATNKNNFFKGTVNQFGILDYAMTNSEMLAYMGG